MSHPVFHQVGYKHLSGEVGNYVAVVANLLQYLRAKNYQNTMRWAITMRFDKVTEKQTCLDNSIGSIIHRCCAVFCQQRLSRQSAAQSLGKATSVPVFADGHAKAIWSSLQSLNNVIWVQLKAQQRYTWQDNYCTCCAFDLSSFTSTTASPLLPWVPSIVKIVTHSTSGNV